MTYYNELRKLAERATPGPWEPVGMNGPEYDTVITADDDPVCHAHPDDVAFIAACNPRLILGLLAKLEAADHLTGFFGRYAKCSCGEQEYNIHDGVCGWCGEKVQ